MVSEEQAKAAAPGWAGRSRAASAGAVRSPRSQMRALIVTNMYPSPAHPALGSFVRDQVRALERIDGVDLELFSFDPGGPGAYLRAARDLRQRYRAQRFDVVHSHFGLTAWPGFAVRARA